MFFVLAFLWYSLPRGGHIAIHGSLWGWPPCNVPQQPRLVTRTHPSLPLSQDLTSAPSSSDLLCDRAWASPVRQIHDASVPSAPCRSRTHGSCPCSSREISSGLKTRNPAVCEAEKEMLETWPGVSHPPGFQPQRQELLDICRAYSGG